MTAPVRFPAGRLLSLWDLMIELDVSKFVAVGNWLATLTQAITRGQWVGFPARNYDELVAETATIKGQLAAMDLRASLESAKRLEEVLSRAQRQPDGSVKFSVPDTELIKDTCGEIITRSRDELRSTIVLVLSARDVPYFAPEEPLFGIEVQDAYPSASDDIAEAGKCLALERGTASVMHLMRATEVPLRALARAIGVGQQNDWGSYIREIDCALSATLKTAGKRTPDEAFYAEASESFERVKRAWRNRTMHIDQTYTVERARAIFDATRDFMRHLAPRVRE